MLNWVTVIGEPSTSLSLLSTLPASGALFAVVIVSEERTGASLTDNTTICTVLGAETAPPSSVTVKVNEPLPKKLLLGMYKSCAACAAVKVWPASTGVTPSGKNSAPEAGTPVMVTPAMAPSTSWPPSDTGSTPSSRPVTAEADASGASLVGVSATIRLPDVLPCGLVTV